MSYSPFERSIIPTSQSQLAIHLASVFSVFNVTSVQLLTHVALQPAPSTAYFSRKS